jgi:hypothetical protein
LFEEQAYSCNTLTEEELKEDILREISNIPAEHHQKGNKKTLPPVRGMSTCRATAFSTPPLICEER